MLTNDSMLDLFLLRSGKQHLLYSYVQRVIHLVNFKPR